MLKFVVLHILTMVRMISFKILKQAKLIVFVQNKNQIFAILFWYLYNPYFWYLYNPYFWLFSVISTCYCVIEMTLLQATHDDSIT